MRFNEAKKRKKFRVNEFKELDAINSERERLRRLVEYANQTLDWFGSGSSRFVYKLSSKKVLKIAKDEVWGTSQNEVEARYSKMFPFIFTHVFDASHRGSWVVSELVNPVRSLAEVCDYFGIKHDGLPINAMHKVNTLIIYGDSDALIDYVSNWNMFIKYVTEIEKIIKNTDINVKDFHGSEQWGKTVDGRYVLLDYGDNA